MQSTPTPPSIRAQARAVGLKQIRGYLRTITKVHRERWPTGLLR